MRSLFFSLLAVGFLALSASPAAAQMQPQPTEEVEMTAQVVDLSCKIAYDLSGEGHRQCTQVCADNGVPLGLVSEDGKFFLPVTFAMPGGSQNEQLYEHAEQKVKVKGKIFTRAGMNAIVIESVEAV